jgi:type IX secretion system PorP/SprF family membrane protein
MKNINLRFMFVAGLVTMIKVATAQDIHFSQIFETPLYRNPALAGIMNADIRVQTVFRTQWNTVANAYNTASLNAEYKMPVGKLNDYLTVGLETFYDHSGSADLTTTIFMPAVNFHKSLSEERNMYLSLGFMGGYVSRNLNRAKITTNNQFDYGTDGETLDNAQYGYWDGGTGISFNSSLGQNPDNNLVVGVAYHHFNTPKNSFYENANIILSPKWVFSADLKVALNEVAAITFYSDFSKQTTYSEFIGGMLFSVKQGPLFDNPRLVLYGGSFFRLNDAIIPVIKIEYQPFSFAFSYDINVSKLKPASNGQGGVELSLSYVGFTKRDNSSLNAFRCPRF